MVGIDLSEKMLERARADTLAIEYRHRAIEDIDPAANNFDVAFSSLALHYVENFAQVCRRVHRGLVPGGRFVFSVKHPAFTARAAQDWRFGPNGERQHGPVDDYQQEGARQTRLLDNDVVKYHRTIATFINTLIESGFSIRFDMAADRTTALRRTAGAVSRLAGRAAPSDGFIDRGGKPSERPARACSVWLYPDARAAPGRAPVRSCPSGATPFSATHKRPAPPPRRRRRTYAP